MRNLSRWLLPCLFLAAACTKVNLDEDLGDAVPATNKDAAVEKAFGTKSVDDIKPGEFTLTEYSQSAFGGTPLVIEHLAQDVLSKEDFSDHYILKVLSRDYMYDENGIEHPNKWVDDFYVGKSASTQSSSLANKAPETLALVTGPLGIQPKSWTQALPAQLPEAGPIQPLATGYSPCSLFTAGAHLPSGYKLTLHKLKVEERQVPPPQLVANSSSCGGIPGCLIQKHIITYDELLRDPGDTKMQYHCTIEISPDVPYLSGLMKRCTRFLAEINKRKVPVDLCAEVVNFKAQ